MILGIGGTTRAASSSELVLRAALAAVAARGADIKFITGPELVFPIYAPESASRDALACRFSEAIRGCDGLVISIMAAQIAEFARYLPTQAT